MFFIKSIFTEALVLTYGKWGALYRRYLVSNNKELYYILLSSGELYDRIAQVDLKAERLYEETVKKLQKKGNRGLIEKKAEEIVFAKIKDEYKTDIDPVNICLINRE